MSLANQERQVIQLLDDKFHGEKLNVTWRRPNEPAGGPVVDEQPFDKLPSDPTAVWGRVGLAGLDSEDDGDVDRDGQATWSVGFTTRDRTLLTETLDILLVRLTHEWRRPFSIDRVTYSKNNYAVVVNLG